ncbi:MAG: hypothetical protein U0559_02820 [Anaerolineae bacterium]
MSTPAFTRLSMSPLVKRSVIRWIVRETIGVVTLAALLFLTAGAINWMAGWAVVIIMTAWVVGTALVVIPRYPELLAERVGPRKGSNLMLVILSSVRSIHDDRVDRGRAGFSQRLVERDGSVAQVVAGALRIRWSRA